MTRVRSIMLMALGLAASARAERCSSGTPALEAMLERGRHAGIAVSDAGMASSADLGFMVGQRNDASGRTVLLGLFRRGGADCVWVQIFDGRVAAGEHLSADAGMRVIDDFERAALGDGVAPALHTYALDRGFELLIAPTFLAEGSGAASDYLTAHPWPGSWRDTARDRSADGTLLYALGDLLDRRGRIMRHYLQIWQYDEHVANWGLRVLWSSARLERD